MPATDADQERVMAVWNRTFCALLGAPQSFGPRVRGSGYAIPAHDCRLPENG
jgi:hypothetical protein